MQEVTVQEAIEKLGITQGELAKTVGVCDAVISRIKNGDSPITESMQILFQKAYPDMILVGGKEKWKEKYLAAEEEIQEQRKQIQELLEKVQQLMAKSALIQKICEEGYLVKTPRKRGRKKKGSENNV